MNILNGFAVYDTPVGFLRMEYEDEDQDQVLTSLNRVSQEVTDFGVKTDLTDNVYSQLLEYFKGKRKEFDFPYKMQGTEFQKKVWKALLDIPYGETRSYKEIAKAVGNEKASRAIGMANNKNHIMIIIPCHRVIGSDGNLVGYAGGIEMKQFLLKLEEENK